MSATISTLRTATLLVAIAGVLGLSAARSHAAALIVNEFNAVSGSGYLNGGDAAADGDGNAIDPPADARLGRVEGNGGDWIELAVIGDHIDIRGWKLEICELGDCNDELVFSNDSVWSDLRAGTLITVAEDQSTDLSFDPDSGDWWMNVQAENGGSASYITPSNFPVSEKDWNVTIYDAAGARVFGPVGEHVPEDPAADCYPPQDDLNSGEIFRLEQAPTALIDPCRASQNDYEDGVLSTFGLPNEWNSSVAVQDFSRLRGGIAYPDVDGDGIADDGDFSGVAGDNPCTGDSTVDCDDNCGGLPNPSQADAGGPGGADGIGDACQCGDPTGDDDVTTADLLEMRELRAGLRSELTVPERCSVHSSGQCSLVDLVVTARALTNPALEPGLAPTCQAAAAPADVSDLMFHPDRIVDVNIRIDLADWNTLRVQQNDIFSLLGSQTCGNEPWNDPYTFFPTQVTVDGQVLPNSAVRKKGFQGSLSDTKPSFKVKFDHSFTSESGTGQQLNGMDRLTLNNNNQDPAHIKQCLGYDLMRQAGLPAPRCNFAHVTVTTVDGGSETTADGELYTHVDSIKDPFLRRHFGSDGGRLYEGALSDFWTGSFRGTIQPKSDEAAADTSEVDALTSALMDGGLSDAQRLVAIEGLVDVDAYLTFWAAEGMIGHWDGYADDQNNFWFYVNPADGLIHFIPWGIDDTFGRGSAIRSGDPNHADAIVPRAALPRRLYEIASTKTQYLARLQQLMDTVWDETSIHAEIDRMEALITPITGSLTSDLNAIRTFVDDHRSSVQAEINSPPLGFSGQPNHFCFFNP